MSDAPELEDAPAEALMGQVVDDFLSRLQRGERPEIEAYVQRHPQLATVLRQMLPALQLVQLSAADEARALGDTLPQGLSLAA